LLWRLFQKRLGFRCLMDVIPLESEIVRGSHGAPPADALDYPVLVLGQGYPPLADEIESTDVCRVVARTVGGFESRSSGAVPSD